MRRAGVAERVSRSVKVSGVAMGEIAIGTSPEKGIVTGVVDVVAFGVMVSRTSLAASLLF